MSGTTETCEGHYNDTQRPLPTHHVASVAVDELDHKHVMLCRRTSVFTVENHHRAYFFENLCLAHFEKLLDDLLLQTLLVHTSKLFKIGVHATNTASGS
jgi:hypothetical protein